MAIISADRSGHAQQPSNKASSDAGPGPGICDSKYVEDAKAARSVRVWDRVPMKNMGAGGLR